MPRMGKTKSPQTIATTQREQVYGKTTPKLLYDIMLRRGKCPMGRKELFDLITKNPPDPDLADLGLPIPLKDSRTIKTIFDRLGQGAEVDGMGNLESLKAMIQKQQDAKSKGEFIEAEIGGTISKQLFEAMKNKGISEGYQVHTETIMTKVAKVLQKADPQTWTGREVYQRILNPLLDDFNPFVFDKEERPLTPRKLEPEGTEYSPLTINGVAVAIRKVAKHLKVGVEQGGIDARFNSLWSQHHDNRTWIAPRTFLTRTEYKQLKDALISQNRETTDATGKWTVGELVALAGDIQIVTGMREKKETLGAFKWGIVNLQSKTIIELKAKKNEIWKNLPLSLFNNLCFDKLKEWHDYQESRGRTGDKDNVIPLTYNTYSKAIKRAREFLNAKGTYKVSGYGTKGSWLKVSGHAYRRTHATWLFMAGISIDLIADGSLGVGWKTIDTLRNHYLGRISEKTIWAIDKLNHWSPFMLTEAEEAEAKRLEAGELVGELKQTLEGKIIAKEQEEED